MKKHILRRVLSIIVFIGFSFIYSCSGSKSVANKPVEITNETVLNSQQIVPLYQGTQDREIDIIHTKLLVDLNWEKQQ